MAPLDLDTQRLLESALYGTPSYHGIRTPDGRVVTELHRLRLDEDKRHGQMTRIQGDLVDSLRRSNQGSTTIARSDFDSRSAELLPAFREAASRIQDLNHTQAALLNESRALGRITAQGFNAVEGQLVGVRSDLREVSGDIVQMDAHVTGAIQEGTRTLHGPSLPAESLTTLVNRGQLFFDALSVYSKAVLTPGAAYELEQMVNQRLGSPMAKAALKAFVDQKVEETITKMRKNEPDEEEYHWTKLRRDMRKTGYELGGVIDNPSQLIGRSSHEAREKLAALEQISRACPDQALRGFVHEAYGLISLQRKASGASIPEAFLIDLTNSGLVVDSIQHQVKRGRREARLGGTDVDRNYNLMELLEQGDHAKTQRGRLIEVAEKQLAVSNAGLEMQGLALGQRYKLLQVGLISAIQGVQAAEQREEILSVNKASLGHLASIDAKITERDDRLRDIVSNLSETNDHLVNLELLGLGFIDAVEYGFESVNATLMLGFGAVVEGLDIIASEIALSRAAIVGRLKGIDESIQLGTKKVVAEVAYGNKQLERLVALQEESLLNLAQQKLKQGQLFLKGAKTQADFKEAAEIFRKGIDVDPSFLENQFGLAVAAEGYDDINEAKKRYRNAGRLAGEERKDLCIGGWVGLAKLEEKEGNLPEAIEATRFALDRDPKNPNLRIGLARLLALAGLEEESAEILLSLIEADPKLLFTLKLNPAFSSDLQLSVYKEVLKRSGPSRGGIGAMLFLLNEFISMGEGVQSLELFDHLLRVGPRHLLKSFPFELAQENVDDFKKLVLSSTSTRFAEDWYAVAYISLLLEMETESILKYFQQGLKNDLNFHRGNKNSVKESIKKLRSADVAKLTSTLISSDPSLAWLNNI